MGLRTMAAKPFILLAYLGMGVILGGIGLVTAARVAAVVVRGEE